MKNYVVLAFYQLQFPFCLTIFLISSKNFFCVESLKLFSFSEYFAIPTEEGRDYRKESPLTASLKVTILHTKLSSTYISRENSKGILTENGEKREFSVFLKNPAFPYFEFPYCQEIRMCSFLRGSCDFTFLLSTRVGRRGYKYNEH